MPAPMVSLDRFGRMVRDARIARGKSQTTLSGEVGIKQSVLSAIECNRRADVSAALVGRLAEALGLDAGELCEAAADRPAPPPTT
jgi:transcriptional regulator with XRE-family HTH domain